MTDACKGRILIVDDEEIIRAMACALLSLGGYEAEAVESGGEAVKAVGDRGGYDIVILDLSMPGMSGAEALQAIKDSYPGQRVLISSGHEPGKDVESLLDAGATGFIQKPYLRKELIEAVEKVLGSAPSGA